MILNTAPSQWHGRQFKFHKINTEAGIVTSNINLQKVVFENSSRFQRLKSGWRPFEEKTFLMFLIYFAEIEMPQKSKLIGKKEPLIFSFLL